MAMGRAIVASELEQIAEVLSDGFRVGEPPRQGATALLVKPGDAAQLAQGLRILIEQPELRDGLGRAARELALTKYTWSVHVDHIVDRLKKAAE
jgi:glycosyltransferase involved in cell wall biosynthesis